MERLSYFTEVGYIRRIDYGRHIVLCYSVEETTVVRRTVLFL